MEEGIGYNWASLCSGQPAVAVGGEWRAASAVGVVAGPQGQRPSLLWEH